MSIVVVFFWIPQIKEIKKTEKFEGSKTFRRMIFKETKPTILEEVHEIMSINKYLKK